jgi:hypothetical protein
MEAVSARTLKPQGECRGMERFGALGKVHALPRQARRCAGTALSLILGCAAVVIADEPGRTTLSDPSIRYAVPEKAYGAVDDEVLPGHRAGYSGVALLRHARRRENVFVPAVAGLNFEHVHDGTVQERNVLYEPRVAPMELRRVNEHTAELYQKPTPHWGLESCTRYELLADGALEMTFECVPRRRTFRNHYVGLFWASYIHQPASGAIHFLGHPTQGDRTPRWLESISPAHGTRATHLAADDHREFVHDEKFPMSLVFNESDVRYDEPWYYGVSHGMALVQIFRPRDHVRFAQSPSGGGAGNPAWDFQTFLPDYQLDQRSTMVMRMLYLPFESAEQVRGVVEPHRAALER